MYKQYPKILLICLSFLLTHQTTFGTLFDGHPSGSKKCEGGSWPTFTDQKQILNLFDPDWEKITLKHKETKIKKTYYFNLIGLQKPEQIVQMSKMSESDLRALEGKEDIALVPYRQDKKNREEVCHYAFRLKGEANTLVQIARVETIEDQDKFTRNGLLLTGLDRHLKDLGAALPHLLPAIGSTVTAVIAGGKVVDGGMPATPDVLQGELSEIISPATTAADEWALFLNALLGLNDDEDAQV